MQDFTLFKNAIHDQMQRMSQDNLFVTNISKDDLWDTYLTSFPEGSNPIFRERTVHDCQCCKQFIRRAGAIVTINDDYSLTSIWDIDIGGDYQIVAKAMSILAKSMPIRDIYLSPEQHLGTDFNHEMLDNGQVKQWDHFHFKLPDRFVVPGKLIGTTVGDANATQQVFQRSLTEITTEAAEIVNELIGQNSLYRGTEYQHFVDRFLTHKPTYDTLPIITQAIYAWTHATKLGHNARIRNTAIGTLLVDLSEGTPLDNAVHAFEAMVAPANYKRSSALVTRSMIAKAQEKVEELGITNSLPRRFAVMEDVTVDNVIYANRKARNQMNAFDELTAEAPVSKKRDFNKLDVIDIDDFLINVVPKADNIEVMVENKHTPNFMSLLAPIHSGTKPIFKWDNNFSWSYNGEVTDSIKERVKQAGGSVTGVLRFSIQWNDGDNNQSDYDAHCYERNSRGDHIYYPHARQTFPSSGVLDVDIINPYNRVAVENITYSNISKMPDGIYEFGVHCYSHRGGRTGFTAQIEFDGQIFDFTYAQNLPHNKYVTVAKVAYSRADGFKLIESLSHQASTKQEWGITTQTFVPVSAIMYSPNYWDHKRIGNKHTFFILEGCKTDKPARGFYNEFLRPELNQHRKVFEMLAAKMKAEPTDRQLSGLGFSATQRNHLVCKVSGSFNRMLKIKF